MTSISRAIIEYFDHGNAAWPQSNVDAFDALNSSDRKEIDRAFMIADEIQPDWTRHDLASATAWARSELARQLPDLSDEALDALSWSLSYGWK